MKLGDVVSYTEGGEQFAALVLGERSIADHAGQNDEPLLTLAFVKALRDGTGAIVSNVAGTGRQTELVQIRSDVAHESLTDFDEELKLRYAKTRYEGGRWTEFHVAAPEVPSEVPAETPAPEAAAETADEHAA